MTQAENQPRHERCVWSGQVLQSTDRRQISLSIPVLLAPPKELSLSVHAAHEPALRNYASSLNQRNLRFLIVVFMLPLLLVAVPALHVLMPGNAGLIWLFAGLLPLLAGAVLHEYPVPIPDGTQPETPAGLQQKLKRNAVLGKILIFAGLALAVWGLL